MSKSFSYPNKGTCSKETHIVLNDDHTIESIEVIGGCNGNLKGISRLLKGMKAEDAVQKTTVLPLFPAGRTVVFLFIAIFKNSAYRNGIFAICNSTLLLLH